MNLPNWARVLLLIAGVFVLVAVLTDPSHLIAALYWVLLIVRWLGLIFIVIVSTGLFLAGLVWIIVWLAERIQRSINRIGQEPSDDEDENDEEDEEDPQ